MALLLVPSQYSTIQAAINASSDYDRIEVAAGTYDENLTFSSKSDRVLRAALGATVVVTGTTTLLTLTASSRVAIFGIDFHLTGSGTGATNIIVSNSGGSYSTMLIDCDFVTTAMTGATSIYTLVTLAPGTLSAPTIVRRCKFLTSGSRFWMGLLALAGPGTAPVAYIESNYVVANIINDAASAVFKVTAGTTANSLYVVRNNTFHEGTVYKRFVYVLFSGASATSKGYVYNNVIYGTDIRTPGDAGYMLHVDLPSGSPYVGYNTINNMDADAVRMASPDSAQNVYSAQTLLDGEGHIQIVTVGDTANGYPLYRSGIDNVGTEPRIYLGQDHISFATVPSRGCYEAYDFVAGRPLLHVKHKYVDPVNGMYLETSWGTIDFTGSDNQGFDTPFDVADYVDYYMREPMSTSAGVLEFWYDVELNRYRIAISGDAEFFLECSGMAASMFGTQSFTGTDTG